MVLAMIMTRNLFIRIAKIFVIMLLITAIVISYCYYIKYIKYKKVTIIKIEEGLGNQLYEYAFGYLLNKKYGIKVLYDIDNFTDQREQRIWVKYFLDKYKLNVPLFKPNPFERMLIKSKDISNKPLKKKIRIVKSEKVMQKIRVRYFDASFMKNYEKDLQEMFLNLNEKYQNELDEKNTAMIKEMQSHKNSVVINIRLGDFLKHPELNICNFNYYKKAMKVFEKMEDVHYYIFSDDIEGAKKYFKPNKPHTYVNVNPLEKPYLNLILSASAKHNIISNSTFAIWAGLLNQNPNKIVVCPSDYIKKRQEEQKHVYPDNWIKIDTSKDKPISQEDIDTSLTRLVAKTKTIKDSKGNWVMVKNLEN